ncbi:MAG: BamA/TamA family outer membrane protein [Candidatus Sericytochromatia bacterium]|nr:BamA/TamA family outer membrane protein [Candidatus Sericytochromatia bacterium]
MHRFRFALSTLALTLALGGPFAAPARAQTALFEPGSSWTTLQTPHFRIYHTPELAHKAREVAAIAEDAHRLLVPMMQVEPPDVTEVVISDVFDELNSLAHNSPHRAVWLWMTPPNPDEGMPIGRYDQWLRLLFIHEYTHILQFEHTPWLVNQINSAAGGFIFSQLPTLPIEVTLQLPDLLTNVPSYFTEGLAVYTESKFTGGGRGLEGDFEMTRRMAFWEGKVPAYDQVFGRYMLEWPMGGYEYTWGSAFIAHLVARHGEKAPAEILRQYGVFPYLGFDNAVWRATGETAQQIWADMVRTLGARYEAERLVWKARADKRETLARFPVPKLVTDTGRHHRHPLWLPDGTLWYTEAARNQSAKIYADKLDGSPREVVMSKSTRSAVSVAENPDLVYYEADTSESPRGLTSYRDIFVLDRKTKKKKQLTKNARLFAPMVSPDGKRLVGVPNGGGKTGLAIYDAASGRHLREWLFDQNAYQFGNPVWSPDGKRLAVAVWHAGTRDLWLVDAEKGDMKPLWRDLALDFYPTWTPDGRGLVFVSDRTDGVFNVHVFDLATRRLRALTDVPGGAFDPVVSPDGKQIAFATYSGRGYDIALIPFEAAPAPHGVAVRSAGPVPELPSLPPATIRGISPYNPLTTMGPSTWFPLFSQDEQGRNVTLYTYWQDLLRQQSLVLIGGYGLNSGRLNYGFNYGNSAGALPWSLFAIEYAGLGRQPLFPDKEVPEDIVWANRWQWNKSATLSMQWPGLRYPLFEPPPITGDNWTFGLRTERVEDYALEIEDTAVPDKYADKFPADQRLTPVMNGDLPAVWTADNPGSYHSAFVQWQRAQSVRWPYDYGPSEGQLTTLGAEQGIPVAGMPVERTFTRLWADHRFYVPLPQKHSLALRTTGGLVYNRNGDFYMAAWRAPFGYQPLSTLNRWDLTSATDYSNRMILLRGHNFAVGNRVVSAGLEYRWPIMEVMRGWGEFPLFINQLYGVAFLDGGAFWGVDSTSLDLPTLNDTLSGTGAELRARTAAFQGVPVDLRLGFAQGITRGASLRGDFQVNWGLGTTF